MKDISKIKTEIKRHIDEIKKDISATEALLIKFPFDEYAGDSTEFKHLMSRIRSLICDYRNNYEDKCEMLLDLLNNIDSYEKDQIVKKLVRIDRNRFTNFFFNDFFKEL